MKALITKDMLRFSKEVSMGLQAALGLTGGFDYLNLTGSDNLQQIRQTLERYYILEVRNEEDLCHSAWLDPTDWDLTPGSDAKVNLLALIQDLQGVISNKDILSQEKELEILYQMVKAYNQVETNNY